MDASDVMGLLMLRFVMVAGGIALLAVAAFVLLLTLKRRGRLQDARRYAEPVVRYWAGRPGARGGEWKKAAARQALDHLDQAAGREGKTRDGR
ncbi:hypothetical protein [Actinomadura macrotermitis]|uniref:Uncharacterized protein n=1 Tax=Actinomadura macrotermitis TaxID=2585200 RepID=A0A7K0C6X7_9ACTN|nr:hypothetical protein [Actinomadura macrotermitis]MQY08852.1 hypothetical protein [Actinomadura macrotermitis]